MLLERGHEVWGTSRDPRRLPAHPKFRPVVLDLTDPESVRTAFAEALAAAGGFDVVINNAGGGHFGPVETLSPELMQAQFQTLVFGQLELCQLALAAMRTRGRGLIINVTSLAARLPVPFMGAYNAAKAAMASLTMTLQLELGSSEITVVDLQPGDIRTSFNDAISRADADGTLYRERVRKAWHVVDQNMTAAPPPDLVAHRIAGVIESDRRPRRLTVGGALQAIIAPAIFRVLPQSVRVWGLRKYYRL
ncbi:MAG: SDR family NAD(P)-dependent oxidoreductase [Verrucomicrobiota bacterium]|nr:SDR family NAD(P)-dependent oxidoreductase [Verrucomicrobiota bacterium]